MVEGIHFLQLLLGTRFKELATHFLYDRSNYIPLIFEQLSSNLLALIRILKSYSPSPFSFTVSFLWREMIRLLA